MIGNIGDSNPRPLGPEPSAIPNFATPGKLTIILEPSKAFKHAGAGKIQGIFPQRPHRDGTERHRRGHPAWRANGTGSTPERHPLWPQGRNGVCGSWWSACGSLRRGGTGPGEPTFGPLAQLSSTVGELVQADTNFQAVFAQMIDLSPRESRRWRPSAPLGRGLPHRRDRQGIRANRTPRTQGGSRPNRTNGRRAAGRKLRRHRRILADFGDALLLVASFACF